MSLWIKIRFKVKLYLWPQLPKTTRILVCTTEIQREITPSEPILSGSVVDNRGEIEEKN